MMELIKPGTKVDFIGKIRLFTIVSVLIVVASLSVIYTKGFVMGIDFAGGTVIQVRFTEAVPMDEIRTGLHPAVNGDFILQNFGEPNEVLIRIGEHTDVTLHELSDNVKNRLTEVFADKNPTIQRVEQVGPQVGDDLRKKAFSAMLYSLLGILIYITFRFQWLYGIGAIIALVHDVIFTLGVYSLSGKEFNITVMAAVLTVVGYSLNDKIVIFDRIREKLKTGVLETMSWGELMNKSMNETLSRTIITSLLTFLAVLSLYIFGGEVINGFALVMMVGIVIGTYSSLGVAAMYVYAMRKSRMSGGNNADKTKPVKA